MTPVLLLILILGAITDEWLNIQFFNNVVARNDGQIIYEPMFSLCYKINNLQKNRLYDFEAVSRRLEKVWLAVYI